jgi:glycosyltransferase involved in cell wall biosynthesis
MIFFSIIIPTYNRAHLIRETIDSVLAQTFTGFEVIIIDDGSKDNTRQIIESRYRNDTRVRYFYKQNEERGAARNFGLQRSKGEFAVIFDSDDWMHNNYLLSIYEKLHHLGAGKTNFIATKYQLKEDDGKVINGGSMKLTEGFYNYKVLLKGNVFGCMYAIKLNNPNLKFFPEDRRYATLEDWMFIMENLRNDQLYLIDKVEITVRHNDNRSTANNQRVINVRKLATNWILDHLKLTQGERKELIAWSHYFCGIHEYLDFNRRAAVKEAIAAIKGDGLQKNFLLLLAKSIVGRKLIKAIR